jgi:Monooxygenase af470-like
VPGSSGTKAQERAVADIVRGRHKAEIDGDFVVFLIGAQFSLRHPVRAFRDLGGRRGGMKAMLDHLVAHPEKGLLGYTMGFPVIVQYWRSFAHLERFARDVSDPHAATWREYYRRQAAQGQGAGIWHETYLVRAGEYEAIYNNMPASGLGRAGRLVPIGESSTARLRIRSRDGS